MITQFKTIKTGLDKIARVDSINEMIFLALIVLCFIGDVMGEVSDHTVIIYWLLMAPVFFFCSIIIETAQTLKTSNSVENKIYYSLLFWASAFVSVLIILFLWHASLLAAQSVGLIIHVILGHTVFISGTVLGYQFYLIGLFLLLLAWFTIAMEATVGMTLMLAIPLTAAGLHLKRKFMIYKDA